MSADHDGPERPLEVLIHGELRKLDIAVAQSTVARYLPRPRKPPCQTLRTFLTNHLAETAAIDFFTLLTAAFRFFVFVVRSHHRPRVLHFGVTEYLSLGRFCTPFAHTSRTHFLPFLFLAAASLLFSLQ